MAEHVKISREIKQVLYTDDKVSAKMHKAGLFPSKIFHFFV